MQFICFILYECCIGFFLPKQFTLMMLLTVQQSVNTITHIGLCFMYLIEFVFDACCHQHCLFVLQWGSTVFGSMTRGIVNVSLSWWSSKYTHALTVQTTRLYCECRFFTLCHTFTVLQNCEARGGPHPESVTRADRASQDERARRAEACWHPGTPQQSQGGIPQSEKNYKKEFFFPATEKIDNLIEWLTLFINWTSVWTLVMHVWGYRGPPTRIISTVCVSVYYIIHLYSSLYFGGKKTWLFFIFVVQAQACETDVRAEVSMPAPVTAAEHTRKKTRQDKVRKPAFKKQPLSRTKEKAPCGFSVQYMLSHSLGF